MLKVLAVCAIALAAAGCSRNFGAPGTEGGPLRAVASPVNVAPYGKATITVRGGTGSYSAQIASHDMHSGTPTVDKGAQLADGTYAFGYTAGAVGQRTDVVTISDSAQNQVQVSIAVGPNVSVSPYQTTAAPLQRVSFTVSGGQEPYCLSISPDPSSGTDSPSTCLEDGGTLTHVCAGADAGVGTCIDLPVEDGGVDTAAPFVTLRSDGEGVDTLKVVDATGDGQAQASVLVSQQIGLLKFPASTVPGGQVHVQASGGVPPYTYAIDPRGNLSDASVAPDGTYTAGVNPNVVDTVKVTDAVGAVARVEIPVGSTGVDIPEVSGGEVMLEGNFDGDPYEDVAVLSASSPTFDSSYTVLTIVHGTGEGLGTSNRFYMPIADWPTNVLVGDFNGDGVEDLLFVYSGILNLSDVYLSLVTGRRDGSLDFYPMVDVPPDELSFKSGTPLVSLQLDQLQSYALSTQGYAVGFAPDADGGPRQLVAFSAPSGGNIQVTGHFDLPFSGSYQNEELITARPLPGLDTTLMVAHDHEAQGADSCPSTGLVGWKLAFTLGSSSELERDPGSDVGPLCIPSPYPEFDAPTAVFPNLLQPVPDLAMPDGDNSSVVVDHYTPSGYTSRGFTGNFKVDDFGDPLFAVSYFGEIYPPLLDGGSDLWGAIVGVSASEADRYVVQPDGSAPAVRPDAIAGQYSEVIASDIDGDGMQDAITLDSSGRLNFLRGSLSGHVGVGHTRELGADVFFLASADLDGDGRDDLLAVDTNQVFRIFWGGAQERVAIGPVLPALSNVYASANSDRGVWLLGGDGQQEQLFLLQADDGGLTTTEEADGPPYYDVSIASIRAAGPSDGGATTGALISALDQGNFSDLESPFDLPTASTTLIIPASDGVNISDNPVVSGAGPVVAPLQVSGAAGDDLVIGVADLNNGGGSLQVHLAEPDGGWDTTVSQTVTLPDGLAAAAAYSYSSQPRGPLDRVLVVGATPNSDGSCDDSSAELFVYGVQAGQVVLLGSGGGLPDATTYCEALGFWYVGPITTDGEQGLAIYDKLTYLRYRDDPAGNPPPYLDVVRLVGSNLDAQRVWYTAELSTFALGDFNGDGLTDFGFSALGRRRLDLYFLHPDGSLY